VPWSFEENGESFTIRDTDGYPLAYVYFEDDAFRRSADERMTKDEARRMAVQIERRPELLRIEREAKSGV
jgi:hypothetical protein